MSAAGTSRPAAQRPVLHDAGGTRDATPTWSGLLPLMLTVAFDGSEAGRRAISAEFARMAEAADNWNAHVRESLAARRGEG